MSSLVSVIIPAYNKAKTIEDTIISIIDQTYHNIEIIVIDDCSTDDTNLICQKYINDIHLISNKQNQGHYRSRFNALNKANGDYIIFIDADDWIDIDAIKKCVNTAEKHHADIVQMKINRQIDFCGISVPIKSNYDISRALDACLYDERIFPVSCCSKLYTKNILKYAEQIDFNGFWGEDRLFNLPILANSTKIAYEQNATYYYRWGGESVNKFNINSLQEYKQVYSLKIDWIKKNGYSSLLPQINEELIILLNYHIRQMINSGQFHKNDILSYLSTELNSDFWENISPSIDYKKLYNTNKYSITRIIKRVIKQLL